ELYRDYDSLIASSRFPNGQSGTVPKSIGVSNSVPTNGVSSLAETSLYSVILQGMKSQAATQTHLALQTLTPMEIVDTILIPALDDVGHRYETHDIFLPQLIRSAETVKKAFGVLKQIMEESDSESIIKGTILLATVEGDVHDIGKNIVKILLENYGYRVIDMGKDVPAQKIVDTIKKEKIPLVGLSALMTTTVISMQNIIKLIHSQELPCKIMVGGAVLSESFAKEIGADFFGSDAKSAVKIAQNLFD
ncbi:MAG: cobalamin-dependent protein, partial [Promethearchaeota archaeon]